MDAQRRVQTAPIAGLQDSSIDKAKVLQELMELQKEMQSLSSQRSELEGLMATRPALDSRLGGFDRPSPSQDPLGQMNASLGLRARKKNTENAAALSNLEGAVDEKQRLMMELLMEEDFKKLEKSGKFTKNKDGSYCINGNIYKKYSKRDLNEHLLKHNSKTYKEKIKLLDELKLKKKRLEKEASLLQSKREKQKEVLKELKKKSDEAERFVKKIEFNRRLASIERNAEDEIAQRKREVKSMFYEMDIEHARNISKQKRDTIREITEERLKDEKKRREDLHKGFLEYKQQEDERAEAKRKEREERNKAKQKEREERDTEREKDMEDFNREMREIRQEREREREMEREREREDFEKTKREIEGEAERQKRNFDEEERQRGEENGRRCTVS